MWTNYISYYDLFIQYTLMTAQSCQINIKLNQHKKPLSSSRFVQNYNRQLTPALFHLCFMDIYKHISCHTWISFCISKAYLICLWIFVHSHMLICLDVWVFVLLLFFILVLGFITQRLSTFFCGPCIDCVQCLCGRRFSFRFGFLF